MMPGTQRHTARATRSRGGSVRPTADAASMQKHIWNATSTVSSTEVSSISEGICNHWAMRVLDWVMAEL